MSDIYQIDRDSFEPAYLQLANILRRQISEGVFRPGDQLPSEAQLTRQYGVSPMTVRRSINLLADQGVVSPAQGRGTFVKGIELSTAIFDLSDLHELFTMGTDAHIQLLDVRIQAAEEHTAQKLDIPSGALTILISRLFLQGDVPIFYHRAHSIYDPARPIIEAEMDVTSLQGLFSGEKNALLKYGQLSIEAILLNEEEAGYLQCPIPAAAFSLEHVFYDFDNHPISWGRFIIPSDRMHLSTDVGIQD